MDTKLEGQYPQKAAFAAATLALKCLNADFKSRPEMSEVVAALEDLQLSKSAAKSPHSKNKIRNSPLSQHRSL